MASSPPYPPSRVISAPRKIKESDNIRNLKKVKRRNTPPPNHHSSPSRSSSALSSANLSARSLSSDSDASLASPSSSPAAGGTDVLTTSVFARNSSTAWLHRSSASRSAMLVRGGTGELPRLLQDARPQGFLLASPLEAILKKMLPGLDVVLAPPAGGVRASGGPRQILADLCIYPLEPSKVSYMHTYSAGIKGRFRHILQHSGSFPDGFGCSCLR